MYFHEWKLPLRYDILVDKLMYQKSESLLKGKDEDRRVPNAYDNSKDIKNSIIEGKYKSKKKKMKTHRAQLIKHFS